MSADPRYAALLAALAAEAAKGAMPIDLPVYAEAGRDPTEPVLLGSGSLSARLGIFGRDPGRNEVIQGEPFIGAGGRLVRDGLFATAGGVGAPSEADRIAIGAGAFWANTVPYKPLGNKAWSVPIKRRFVPQIATLLAELWQGDQLLVLGNEALTWFALAEPNLKGPIASLMADPDRYHQSLPITLRGKALVLHPLPHPSPLNATWYPRFPALLAERLQQVGWTGPEAA